MNTALKIRTHEIVEQYATKWRSLLAWGAPIPMEFKLKPHRGTINLGFAYPGRGTCEIKITGSLSRDLATLLHEYAHLAAPTGEHHDIAWKTVYARAAAEAFGCDVDDFELDVTKYDMDKQVIDACEVWLDELAMGDA